MKKKNALLDDVQNMISHHTGGKRIHVTVKEGDWSNVMSVMAPQTSSLFDN